MHLSFADLALDGIFRFSDLHPFPILEHGWFIPLWIEIVKNASIYKSRKSTFQKYKFLAHFFGFWYSFLSFSRNALFSRSFTSYSCSQSIFPGFFFRDCRIFSLIYREFFKKKLTFLTLSTFLEHFQPIPEPSFCLILTVSFGLREINTIKVSLGLLGLSIDGFEGKQWESKG